MKILTALAFLVVCLWSWGAGAQISGGANSGWTDGAGTLLTTQPTSRHVVDRTVLFFEWEGVGTDATNDSEPFFVEQSALICFNADTGDINPPAVAPGVVTPRQCPELSTTVPTVGASRCLSIGALTGLEGASGVQAACTRVARGWYFLDLTTAVPSGDDALAWIIGEHW